MHMTKRKDWLTNYNPTMKKEIICANDTKLFSAGIGNLICSLNNKQAATMNEVIYVPNLSTKLSVSTMVKRDLVITFMKQGCKIFDKNNFRIRGKIKATTRKEGGVYKLNRITERASVSIVKSDKVL